LPASAFSLRLTQNWSSAESFFCALVSPFFSSGCGACSSAPLGCGPRSAAALADAVADVADRVEPAHVLLLQEIDGIAVAFGEQRDQHVGAGHRILARGLDMQDGALDHALEAGGGSRVALVLRLERLVFLDRGTGAPHRPDRPDRRRRPASPAAASSSSISASSRCSSVAYSWLRSGRLDSAACSVEETLAKHFAGQSGLVVAEIDLDGLGDAVRWEVSRGGALFPHLYAPLPSSAVRHHITR
jgi:hypothetical protein